MKVKVFVITIISIFFWGGSILAQTAEEWFNKGMAFIELGQYQDAISAFDKAIEINPKYANAWNNKGVALGRLGRYKEAKVCYDKAKELRKE